MVKFGPTRPVVVGQGTVGLVAAGRALHVPVPVQLGLKNVATGRTNRMQDAAIVALSEVQSNHGFDLFDDGPAHISSSKSVGGLVHEAVNQSGHEELAVEMLGLNGTRLAFNRQDHGLAVLFIEFDHLAQHGIAHAWFHDVLGRKDMDGATIVVHGADDRCYDVAVGQSRPFAVFVLAFFGKDASWCDEARRHVSHFLGKRGPRWVARRSPVKGGGSFLFNPPYGFHASTSSKRASPGRKNRQHFTSVKPFRWAWW